MAKKKLTFFTLGGDMFLKDIIINLRKDYDIKFFNRGTDTEFKQLLHDSDIAWFEFCDQLAVAATKAPKLCKYVTRLHSYEMFTDMPSQVDWNKMDNLIFVSNIVHDYCVKKYGIPEGITSVINNGVNVDKYKIPEKKKFNKKVAFIGYMNYKKGPQMMIDTFRAIHAHDPEYTFHIAGEHQDERIHLYFEQIQKELPFKIYWEGWQQDISKFLKDKDFIVSTSLFESFQYALAEGMLQGCVPLVHNWIGARDIYPNEFVFNTSDEAVEIVKAFEDVEDKTEVYTELRKHIADRYSLDKQIASVKELLETL